MLTIICGEDVISSRNYLQTLKQQYLLKNFEVKNISVQEIESISLWLGESQSLFFTKRIFFSEYLNRHIRRDNKKLLAELKKIEKLKDVELIDWESVSLWELKLAKVGNVKEFKPRESIFKLLDSLYPTNKSTFLSLLLSTTIDIDEHFIFTMVVRYVRNLIVIKMGSIPLKMQSWQAQKLKLQASFWKSQNLFNFYEALFKIEIGTKTSTTPYSIKNSLAILACHFL